ncbi:hypothetical protein BGZ63DRAFT_388461 [Mariannaea sp. PMI_226]|nr:hypothetical protein BGZ63DRAFT_388461 [Mariannaea sp. PMI_226]
MRHPGSPVYPSANADIDRCAPKFFRSLLRDFGPDAVRRIRKATMVFPAMDATYLTPSRFSWSIWLEVLELLKKNADLTNLELTVSIAMHVRPEGDDIQGRDWDRFDNITAEDETDMLEAYKQIFTPMKELCALKKLFVYVAWPFQHAKYSIRNQNQQMLERIIMGESYDSDKLGKPRMCFWSEFGEDFLEG